MTTWDASATAEEVSSSLAAEIKGKNILITGVSPGGLGAEAVRVLAKYASLIVLAGRSKEKLEATIAATKAESPHANLRILILDLFSVDSVRIAAAQVLSYEEPIHVLINNAAIEAPTYSELAGVESQLYANHLMHFLFTNLVLPKIRAAASPEYSPRIITVSSAGHRRFGVQFDDLNFQSGAKYNRMAGYAQSKTANILFTRELAKRVAKQGILTFTLHPGGVYTHLMDSAKAELVALGFLNPEGGVMPGKPPLKTIPHGTATHIVAAFDPSIKDQSGAYLVDCQVHNDQLAPHATDPQSAEKLWALSETLVGQTF